MSSSSEWLLQPRQLDSNTWSVTILPCSACSSFFIANVASFVVFMRLETLDLLTNPFCLSQGLKVRSSAKTLEVLSQVLMISPLTR